MTRMIAEKLGVSVTYLCGETNMKSDDMSAFVLGMDLSKLNDAGTELLRNYYGYLASDPRYCAQVEGKKS